MKVERKEYKYKKYLIHILIAGATAFSLATVSHVNAFVHSGQQTTTIAKTKSKTRQRKIEAPDTLSQLTENQPIEPPKPGGIHVAPEVFAPAQVSTEKPAPSEVKKTESTITAPSQILEKVIKKMAPPAQKAKPSAAPIETTSSISTEQTSSSLITSIASRVGIDMKFSKIDTGFIRKVEGSLTKGYVPAAGNSGVTVGDGVDLGQMHLSELNSLPIDNVLKGKLRPYVGLKRFQAKSFLRAHPLNISETELVQLNAVAANKILIPLVKEYNKSSRVNFFSLPAGAQTAIFSYGYQWGPFFGHISSGKSLWNAYTHQDWKKASSILKNSRQYSSRRHQEASLLANL